MSFKKYYLYYSESIESSDSVISDSFWPHGLCPTRCLCLWDFPGKNTGMDWHLLLQGIFLTHGSNPCLPHCRRIFLLSELPRKSLHQLNRKIPFSTPLTSIVTMALAMFLSASRKYTQSYYDCFGLMKGEGKNHYFPLCNEKINLSYRTALSTWATRWRQHEAESQLTNCGYAIWARKGCCCVPLRPESHFLMQHSLAYPDWSNSNSGVRQSVSSVSQ